MTREELINTITKNVATEFGFSDLTEIIDSGAAEFIIDEVLLNFESRTCGNCKYNKEQDGFMIFCDKVMCQDGSKIMWHSFTKDFSCKYWKAKQ